MKKARDVAGPLRGTSRQKKSAAAAAQPALQPKKSKPTAVASKRSARPAKAKARPAKAKAAGVRMSARLAKYSPPRRVPSKDGRIRFTEPESVPLELNKDLRSKLIPDWLQTHPELLGPIVEILDGLLLHGFHHPSEGKEEGVSLEVQNPHNRYPVMNVYRDNYLRQLYGAQTGQSTATDKTEYRYSYGSGSGKRSVGG